jgi:hydrogenase/urease accessory protein HupE
MLLLVLFGSLLPRPAGAHDLRPAALRLEEVEPGRFRVEWLPPPGGRELTFRVEPRFPAHCAYAAGVVDCGPAGLVGAIGFPELAGTSERLIVEIRWLGAKSEIDVVEGDSPTLEVDARRPSLGSRARLARRFVGLGVHHILSGLDHLLFVVGLVMLVRGRRRLLLTITAFTLAHSLTLALSVLGVVRLPAAPVEAAIALSILLVAVEIARGGASLGRRAPWLLAFAFGLLHGFGFAGALSRIGVPRAELWVSLGAFNVGVELGQLAVVAAALVLRRLARLIGPRLGDLERFYVYAFGSIAAYFTLERTLLVFGLRPF